MECPGYRVSNYRLARTCYENHCDSKKGECQVPQTQKPLWRIGNPRERAGHDSSSINSSVTGDMLKTDCFEHEYDMVDAGEALEVACIGEQGWSMLNFTKQYSKIPKSN